MKMAGRTFLRAGAARYGGRARVAIGSTVRGMRNVAQRGDTNTAAGAE